MSRLILTKIAHASGGLVLVSGGILAITACVRPGGVADSTIVRVTLPEFKVESSRTAFRAGVPYRLTVENRGQVNHGFLIVRPLGDDASREAVDEAAIVQIPELELQPGAQRAITVTFQAAPRGSLEFACQLPRHHEFGMHQAITVQ